MNISKFTQKSVQAVQDLEKVAYEYGNQEVEQEHLLYALLTQEDSLILKLIEKMDINKEYFINVVKKALDAKESQEAVDNATNSLNKAIKALVKKNSSSVKKTDGTTNKSKTSGSDSVKTGDPASVFGWLGLAVSSLGAGMGGFAWKRRKRK